MCEPPCPVAGMVSNHAFLRELHGKASARAAEKTSVFSWLRAPVSLDSNAKKECLFRQMKIVLWPPVLWFLLPQITASLCASSENANPKPGSRPAAFGNGNSEPGLGKVPGRILQIILHPEVSR